MRSQGPNAVLVIGLLAIVLLICAQQTAAADTIHLKNGRVIRTLRARVDGDQLVFEQYGNEQRIPMALVDKVVRDEPGTQIVLPAEGAESGRGKGSSRADKSTGTDVAAAAAETTGAESVEPEQTEQYWQDKVTAIATERAALEQQMTRLRLEERAFLFSHRSTTETKRKIDAAQKRQGELDDELAQLRRDARRAGVPPGWLRVRTGSGSGSSR